MRQLPIIAISAAAAMLAGCVQPPPSRVSGPVDGYTVSSTPQYAYEAAQPDDPNAGVYIDPPLDQPAPVLVEWAPPPLLDEPVPPPPYPDAIWTGGYWVWQDNWVWARGRWLAPPRPDYRWVRPYYEHRGNAVIFINGFWARPGVSFRRPPPTLNIPFARVRPGVVRGPRPSGPEGPFMPPPHGARRGSFVPAPLPQPQAARPPEHRPPQSEAPRTREPLPAAPVRSSPDRPYEPGTQMRPDRSPQDRGQDRNPNLDQRRSQNDQSRTQAREPNRDQSREQDRDANRNQARPPGMMRPQIQRPPSAPQQQAQPRPQPQPQVHSVQPPAPQAAPPQSRPQPQPRPERRAAPRENAPAAAAPAPAQRHEGRERGNRDGQRP